MRYLLPIALGVVSSTAVHGANANELLVFISAFATGDPGGIHAYRLRVDTGQLKLVHRTADVEHRSSWPCRGTGSSCIRPMRRGSSGAKEHEQVAAYELVGTTGQLKLLNRQSALGSAACYVDVDATGKTVVVANYSTGSVASFPVRATDRSARQRPSSSTQARVSTRRGRKARTPIAS